MTQPVDLDSFQPRSAGELFDGIVSHAVPIIGSMWSQARDELEIHFSTLAQNSFQTMKRLAEGRITREKADALLHMQELYLNNILLYSEFLVYDMAQAVLDAVFSVVKAAVRNWTGIMLNF